MNKVIRKIMLTSCVVFLLSNHACAFWDSSPDLDVNDNKIVKTITKELVYSDAVHSHMVDVSCDEGVVKLSGSVANILAKERARKLASMVKGVRSIVNNISVNPVIRSDKALKRDIEIALAEDPAAESYKINVKVRNGKAILNGSVQSWAEKRLGAHVAKSVNGVKEVSNNLTIRYKSDRPAAEIEPEIKERLKMDPYIYDALINVSVNNEGEVKITGTVASLYQKYRAENKAWVNGVSAVDAADLAINWSLKDEMRRKGTVTLQSDDKIREAVKDALSYDPRLYSFNITVMSVGSGKVTLNGTVTNFKAKKAAAQDARNTLGVWHVDNNIKVRPDKIMTNEAIADDIRDALARNPFVENYEIAVSVRNNKAYLTGVVDSYFEKKEAADVASTVPGVVTVANNLATLGETWTWKNDKQIKADINDELFWSLLVDSDQVKVRVDEGTAKLYGTVDNRQEMDAAVENAFEGGAKRVVCKLNIRGTVFNGATYYYDEYISNK
jgi:osmotically-inducible protein OsmY